jgi:hypothetical protein
MRRFVAFAAASVAAFSLVFITVSRNYEVAAESSPSEIEGPAFENYDIREAEPKAFREAARGLGIADDGAGDVIRKSVRGAASARSGAVVEFSRTTGMAETITIDPAMPGLDGEGGRTQARRSFINRTPDLFGGSFVGELEDAYDYANPAGGLGFAGLVQKVNGIPVFQGEIKAAFDKRNELVRVVNNLAPVRSSPAADFGTPERALAMSVVHVGVDAGAATPVKAEKDGKYQYERGQFADEPSSEKVYFPIEPGTLVPAWKTLI